jgi:hypothetical protein
MLSTPDAASRIDNFMVFTGAWQYRCGGFGDDPRANFVADNGRGPKTSIPAEEEREVSMVCAPRREMILFPMPGVLQAWGYVL